MPCSRLLQCSAVFLLLSLLVPAAAARPGPDVGSDAGPRWSVPVERLRGEPVVALHDGGALVLVEDAGHGLTAFDVETGAVRWYVLCADTLTQPPVLRDDLLVLTSGDWLLVVDAHTGRRLVQRVLPSVQAVAPLASEPMLYLTDVLHGRLSAIHLDDGTERWNIDLPGGVVQPLARAGVSGPIVAACGDGKLRALPAGELVPEGEAWKAHTGPLAGPLLSGPDWLASVGSDRRMILRHGAGGRVRWVAILGADPLGGAVLAEGALAAATEAGTEVIEFADGRSRWRVEGEQVLGTLGEALWLVDAAGQGVVRRASDGELLATGLPADALALGGGLFDMQGGQLRRLAW